MGNAFRRLGLVSAVALFFAAGGSNSAQPSSNKRQSNAGLTASAPTGEGRLLLGRPECSCSSGSRTCGCAGAGAAGHGDQSSSRGAHADELFEARMNQWVPAQPPLHGCVGQPVLRPTGPAPVPATTSPGRWRTAFPRYDLLVPDAVPGVSIDTFQPGQQNYTSLLARAKMAQQRGPITGMIFHQGESDNGQVPGRCA